MKHTTHIPTHALNTAVLFLIFNRPDTTMKVFESIKNAQPPRLYISADGPRKNRKEEIEKVRSVREYVISNIDWDCDVKTLFRDHNLGCKLAVSEGIDWFFEHEEQGIILEDDCLPSRSFFWFCEELLNKYHLDERIFLISGYNRQNVWNESNYDYFYSNFGGIWGWASWRRAWKHYDGAMSDIDEFIRNRHFQNLLGKTLGTRRQKEILGVLKSNINTWDYSWAYSRHKNSGMSCVPSKSMIENIGFNSDATHTSGNNTDNVSRHEITFPITKNKFMVADRKYDKLFIGMEPISTKLVKKLRSRLRRN